MDRAADSSGPHLPACGAARTSVGWALWEGTPLFRMGDDGTASGGTSANLGASAARLDGLQPHRTSLLRTGDVRSGER